VATDSTRPPGPQALHHAPGVSSGLVDLLRAVLVDPMVEDLRNLVSDNLKAGQSGAKPRMIEYLFAGPHDDDDIAKLAQRVLRSRRWYSPTRLLGRSIEMSQLGSYLLFHPDFIEGAIELGVRDARLHLDANQRLVWRTTELPHMYHRPGDPAEAEGA
jgi:hypothetical protein